MSAKKIKPGDVIERRFVWLDKDGLRCSPRHVKMSSALEFFKNPDQRWIREDGRPRLVDYDKSTFPSSKRPETLIVIEDIARSLSDEEQARVDQIKRLMDEGLV